MSHVAIIDCEIQSLDALEAACDRLGLSFQEGQSNYAWYGQFVGDYPLPEGFTIADLGHCDHAIKVPGAKYEVGLVYRNGKYNLLWDFWYGGGLEEQLGPNGQKLAQAYAIEAARLEAQRQGYSVWEEAGQDGEVKLHVEVGIDDASSGL